MDVLLAMLQEELSRSLRLERKYVRALRLLPKGSFFVRKVRGRTYGYLTYRREGKVVQKYLGQLDQAGIQRHRQIVKKRLELRKRLSRVRQHLRVLKRALRGKELSTRR
jgi:hypothetical protein